MSTLRVVVLCIASAATAACAILVALGAFRGNLTPTTPVNCCLVIGAAAWTVFASLSGRDQLGHQLAVLRAEGHVARDLDDDLLTTGPMPRPYLRSVE